MYDSQPPSYSVSDSMFSVRRKLAQIGHTGILGVFYLNCTLKVHQGIFKPTIQEFIHAESFPIIFYTKRRKKSA